MFPVRLHEWTVPIGEVIPFGTNVKIIVFVHLDRGLWMFRSRVYWARLWLGG